MLFCLGNVGEFWTDSNVATLNKCALHTFSLDFLDK